MKLAKSLACAAAALMMIAGPAFAEMKVENNKGSSKDATIPTCTRSLGTVSLQDGEGRGWTSYNLGAPSTLLKVFVQKSGCFKLVDRGAGLAAAEKERALASGGNLQRGSNMGGGQIKAADYVLVADVAGADSNSGGSAVGAVAGGLIGGRFGAVAGGLKTSNVEAETVLTLVNVRTSETEATTQGFAKKRDISFGGGGFYGWGGAGGGGYADTEVGKVVGLAFLDAYRQMVGNLGLLPANAGAAAPQKSFVVKTSTSMKRSPANSSSSVRSLDSGMMVYPTGAKEGMWWEVADENDNVGWVLNDKLEPKK